MVQVSVLSSGSSGNAIVIRTGCTQLLLDAGLTCSKLIPLFEQAGLDPEKTDAVLISHEHSDHIGGIKGFLKRFRRPVYVSRLSAPYLKLGEKQETLVEHLEAGESLTIGDIRITPFPVPHDAAMTLGFVFSAEGVKIGYATDLGVPTKEAAEKLRGSHCLLLEFNHDLDLLHEGSYPQHLKVRIAGRLGHLSNAQGAKLLSEVLTKEAEALFLMHLSEENNRPEYARLAAMDLLEGRKVFLEVAKPLALSRRWIA
jgi:phosphoribosyl 1,2-cyclic phosphodiesterase